MKREIVKEEEGKMSREKGEAGTAGERGKRKKNMIFITLCFFKKIKKISNLERGENDLTLKLL